MTTCVRSLSLAVGLVMVSVGAGGQAAPGAQDGAKDGAQAAAAKSEVFTVGERSATAGINTEFTPTHVEFDESALSERGRRELIRDLVGEQGFAHRVLPQAAGLTLQANGNLKPGPEEYKKLIYEKGTSAGPGDRVAITALEFKGDRLVIDLNGGPYLKHRFLRHVSIMGADPAYLDGKEATGSRVVLVFEGGLPEVTAPEVKALLAPVVDFAAKKGELAYADTLPTPVKSAIASHEVLVGMNHRMVLAALGAPESKVREQNGEGRYEEWIYGHQPQTVKFVRFVGDRVSLVKIAEVGKPIAVHDQDELAGYLPPAPTREISLADRVGEGQKASAPTLLKPGEKTLETGDTQRKVQVPVDPTSAGNGSGHAPTAPAKTPDQFVAAPSVM
ncbi:hypothetical protein [Granulicella tundricola]|uniref:Uncharacterized protein n=1 Tax=Granulicella tundricola (strain ATCC BAA-1859 / DSM 23138 / MP5ACTX9) TaxID=1198114 RepID=E8X2L6_GRATM|nr:hypothetical protein [Granulicella tundricola]ADW69240.1 hypothetical protein AciX9_2196 [Granulicella tundricola MP5ACTX9]